MKRCFVISPIGEIGSVTRKQADRLLKDLIIPVASQQGYKAVRGDELSTPGVVVQQVIERLIDDPLIIAVLGENNPNVFYELAICHLLKRPAIILKYLEQKLPFDIGGNRVILVDPKNPVAAAVALRGQIEVVKKAPAAWLGPIHLGFGQIAALASGLGASANSISTRNRRLLQGMWSGRLTQQHTPIKRLRQTEYPCSMELQVAGDALHGVVRVTYGDNESDPERNSVALGIHGWLHGGRVVRIHYVNESRELSELHFGDCIMTMHTGGGYLRLTGCFAGMGIESGAAVNGLVEFARRK